MRLADNPNLKHFFADKNAIRKVVEQVNAQTGFVEDPTATPEKVQRMMAALGIRAEDNLGFCGILAARDEE